MKQSKYNILLQKGNRKLVFNQLTASVIELDGELFHCLEQNDIDSIPEEVRESLFDSSILVKDDLNEKNVLMYKLHRAKYADKSTRVTIMPTLDCNFKCWYCYEKHHKSEMTPDSLESLLIFCQTLIEKDNVNSFHLDWFGGEPLLHFFDVVYPVASKLKKLCNLNHKTFFHSITTNGYLINDKMISKMKDICLSSFQITLDGAAFFHNKTRFTKDDKDSYSKIVGNMINLCRNIPNISMTMRINYTPRNVESLLEIIADFPMDVRGKISVCPQLVWQFKKNINATTRKIKSILLEFQNAGFLPHRQSLTCHQCYAESMNQYVVNYDLSVFKCTARDFSAIHSVGKIADGVFIPNSHYFDYSIPTDVIDEQCKECQLLPSCLGRCVQKRVEGSAKNCDKDSLRLSVINDVLLYMNANER